MNNGIARARNRVSVWRGLFLALAMLAGGMTHAVNGWDFAGFYQFSNVTDVGGQKQLTLFARVFNYSGAAVNGATIAVEDRMLPGTSYASFPGLAVAADGNLTVSGQVTVPAAEYQRWQSGMRPMMTVRYTDAAGAQVFRAIELLPVPMGVQP